MLTVASQGRPQATERRNCRPRWYRNAAGFGLFAAIVVATACESPARVKPWRHADDEAPTASAEPQSPALRVVDEVNQITKARDHTLRIAMDSEPKELDPLVAPSEWTRRITVGPVFETLIRYLPPEAGADPSVGRFAPGLARTWKIMPSGVEIRLELEPDAMFHDGKPLTASDVQFTLDAVRDPKRGIDHLRDLMADVQSVELITSHEVRLMLFHPSGWVLRALAEIPIVPEHIYKDGLAASGKLIGSGPYRVTSWKSGVVHLTKFDQYWGKPPGIADVEFVYDADAARVLVAAKRGEMDIVPSLIPAHWPEQASSPGLAVNFATVELPPPQFRYVLFNAATPPTDDANVRRALSMLIDRKVLAKDAYHGLAAPIASLIWPGGPATGVAPPVPVFDPVAAGKLLDAAGWSDHDGDGIRDRNGVSLRVVALATEHDEPAPGQPRLGVPERDKIIEAWKKAGIAVELRLGGDTTLTKKLDSGDFGAAFIEWTGMADSDLSPLLATGGANNLGKFSDKHIDRLLLQYEATWAPAERAALSREFATALAEQMPIAPIVRTFPHGLVQHRVKGIAPWAGWFELAALSFAKAP